MSYGQTRDSEQLRILSVAIGEFIGRYLANPATKNRQTVILFPGAMGSQLQRATSAYNGGVGGPQTFSYDSVWLNVFTFLGAALNLGMTKDSTGTFRDAQDRLIIANGPIDIFGVKPYEDFIDWCDANQLDWFVFGWDWRRRLEEAADFFVQQFLPLFQTTVQAACGADPLGNLTLVGHSSGGLVVDLLLQRCPQVNRAISVGTPFYGTPSQSHRYFEGESFLNYFGTKTIVKLISSMPGGYTLLFLDAATYAAAGPALQNDPSYPLAAYPSLDAGNAAVFADPYNPTTNGPLVRYPAATGFDALELGHGDLICHGVTGGLTAAQAAKFTNIRGVRAVNATAIAQTWGWISPSFDPNTGTTPITDSAIGPGDDVVPAWSARLVGCPNNVVTLKGVANHVFLMNDPKTLQELGQILLGGPSIMVRRIKRTVEPAPSSEARAFVRRLQQQFAKGPEFKPPDPMAVHEYLDRFPTAKLQSVFARVMIDLVAGPAAPPAKPKAAPAKPKKRGAKRKAGALKSPKGRGRRRK
jgi:pimeloyl-ACP methyl ester carboxylesterase